MANERSQTTQPNASELANERRLQLAKRSGAPTSSSDEASPNLASTSDNKEEQRYLAMKRARTTSKQSGAQDLSEVDTSNPKITRTSPLRMNNLGGGLADRRRESEQQEAYVKNALRQLGPRAQEESARMTLARARQRPSQNAKNGLSMKDAMSLAKNPTPTGLTLKLATPSGSAGPGGLPMSGEDIKKMVGNGLIKMSWSNLWMTFGHSIYIIDILFFAGWASKYLRQYIPEIGREWFPGEIGKKIPAHALLPLKLGEIVAISFITFWVLIIDLALLGALGFILGAIMDAGRAVDSISLL
jgi:hypothetical protein